MSDQDIGGLFTFFAVLAGLGFLPAAIASQKGRAFGQWWFYGFFFFPIAFIHSIFLEPVVAQEQRRQQASVDHSLAVANALSKFAQLRDQGLISEEEFAQRRKELLGTLT